MSEKSFRLFVLAVLLAFLSMSAFTEAPKNKVFGGGIASGNIRFSIQAEKSQAAAGRIQYGNVSAKVDCIATAEGRKMATVFFTYGGSTLAVTIIDGGAGRHAEADMISDPFIVDEPDCGSVIPQLSYNQVISGNIEVK